MLIKFRYLLYLLVTLQFPAQATHLLGGEITWECIRTGTNSGKYIFTVKLYRDCNGIIAPVNVTLATNAPNFATGILCNNTTVNDVSPIGTGCPTCANPASNASAVEEHIFQSAPVILSGVPPSNGWYFAFTDCCRSGNITNLSSGSGYFTLRAIMYPYHARNANPCFDSSPQFAERPQLATCIGDSIFYNGNAADQDLDSLVYDWAEPLDGTSFPTSTPYPFATNYYYNNPLPDDTIDAHNINAILDPRSGVLMFRSVTAAVCVSVVKITAYKCGIKVSEIFRELQVSLITGCILTTPPYAGMLN